MIMYKDFSLLPKYEIGSNGTVFAKNYNRTGERRELKQCETRAGYLYVTLHNNGKNYFKTIHRLVAETFIANPENKPQINHKNGNRKDNRLENLEWVTSQENCLHAFRSNGRKHSEKQLAIVTKNFTGVNNPKAKLNEAQVLSIRRLRYKGLSMRQIAERHSISKSQVCAIINNKSWKVC